MITSETDYQFHIKLGFRIIQKDPQNNCINIKKAGCTGWRRIVKCKTPLEMNHAFNQLLQSEKTIELP